MLGSVRSSVRAIGGRAEKRIADVDVAVRHGGGAGVVSAGGGRRGRTLGSDALPNRLQPGSSARRIAVVVGSRALGGNPLGV